MSTHAIYRRENQLAGVLATGLILCALSVTFARAETLITCGASQGRAYYVNGGVVSRDEAGWRSEDITNGKIELVMQGTSYDLHFRDAEGVFSATRNGNAEVMALAHTSDAIVILVVYPAGATEIFQFRPSNREVVWTQLKYAGLVDKASVLRAPCN